MQVAHSDKWGMSEWKPRRKLDGCAVCQDVEASNVEALMHVETPKLRPPLLKPCGC